jgi:Ca-activated chloride channel homolog
MSQKKATYPPLPVLGVLCVLAVNLAVADVGSLMRSGNSQYARGRYDTALSRYQMAEVLEPDASAIHYNLGNALFRLGRYQEAARELELALIDRKPLRRANATYNIGNVAFKAGRLDPAIQAYKQALVMNPRDKQAKQNLEFCLLRKQEQKNDSSQQNRQQNQQQQQQQQQNQPQMQQKQGMSKDQAERLVQAVENKERNQQREQQQKGGRRKVEQDW